MPSECAPNSDFRMTSTVSQIHLTPLDFKLISQTSTLDSSDHMVTPKLGVAKRPSLGLPRPKLKVEGSPVFWTEKCPDLH